MSGIVSYPVSFLSRPCDRDLLSRLTELGCADDTAEIILYRIWRDFASGNSDRRLLQRDGGEGDRVVEMLERFCNWKREWGAGVLVAMAVAADFLSIEPGSGGSHLVCRDFYPINSRFSAGGKSFQRTGAYTQVVNREEKRALTAVGQHLELWQRNANAGFEHFTPALRDEALLFIHTLANCACKSLPSDGELRGGLFATAVKCLETTSQEQRKKTMLLIVSMRKNPEFPGTVAELLYGWQGLVKKAIAEV